MGTKTTISYADHTFSPWFGCEPVSPGCANCFARRWALNKMGVAAGGRWQASWRYWQQPLKWEKALAEGRVWQCSCGEYWTERQRCGAATKGLHDCGKLAAVVNRARVLTDLCDPFDDQVPEQWLARYLDLIHRTPHLDWLVLTKRPQLIRERLLTPTGWYRATLWHVNVWPGVSAENQEWADKRIPLLLTMPWVGPHWVSAEPLLGPIDLHLLDRPGVKWVVVGGMSGPGWRRWLCEIEWIEGIAAQCNVAGVPLWIKQDSGPRPGIQGRIPDELWEIKQLPTT